MESLTIEMTFKRPTLGELQPKKKTPNATANVKFGTGFFGFFFGFFSVFPFWPILTGLTGSC